MRLFLSEAANKKKQQQRQENALFHDNKFDGDKF